MKKLWFKIIQLVIFACFINPMVFASFTKDDVGTSTAQFLKLGVDARAIGMGNAFVAVSNDDNSVYWNPAGLGQIEKKSLSVMHVVYFEDIFYEWLSYAQPSKMGSFGIGVKYLSYGNIKETDETGLEVTDFKPNDLSISISYARKISDIFVGVSAKYISSKIKKTATAYAVDFGVLYKLLDKRLSTGLSIQNIGTKMNFEQVEEKLPINIKLGGAFSITKDLLVSLDVNAPDDGEINFGIGSEYRYWLKDKINITGRIGYNTRPKDTGGINGVSIGFGAGYSEYDFNYAFVPLGDLGNSHYVSLNIKF